MQFALTLVDVNPRLVAAWQSAFADYPEVNVVCDSILRQPADAWVTPTNARGSMDGGVDAVMKRYFGAGVEARVKREIRSEYAGHLPVGGAVCVTTEGLYTPPGGGRPRYLISAATMSGSSEDVSYTYNAAWAFSAAVRSARACCARDDEPTIRSIAVPGLGTSTGRLGCRESARQTRVAYDLLREGVLDTFESWEALNQRLGECRTVPTPTPKKRLFRIF